MATLLHRLSESEQTDAQQSTSAAQLQALLDAATADLAQARRRGDNLRERLAVAEQSAASGSTDAAQARERAANREEEIARLRELLAEAREQIMVFGDTPPTQARVVTYVREQLASGRSLLDTARELGFSESTVRGWVNGRHQRP